jgi:hypothetical protein
LSGHGIVDRLAPNGARHDDGVGPTAGIKGLCVPTGRGCNRATGSGAGFLYMKNLCVRTVAGDIRVGAIAAVYVDVPASEGFVTRRILNPSCNDVACHRSDTHSSDSRRVTDRVGAYTPSGAFRGAVVVNETEDIRSANLVSVNPDGHVVVGDSAYLNAV